MKTVPQYAEYALSRLREGDLAEAESIFDQLLGQITAPDVNVLMGYGTVLISQGKYGLGATLLQTALQLRHDIPELWCNYACALKHLGKDDASLDCYEKALKLAPDSSLILAGIAGFWVNKGEAQKCESYARQALNLDPANDAAHMHLALALLEQGRFEEAWPHYEHRWETLDRKKDKRPYRAPRWRGQYVKTLAIHGEQGLGDEIMFMTAFWRARQHADRVVVECAPRLIPILTEALDVPCYGTHAELIAAQGEPDAYVPMGSLFRYTGIPTITDYLPRHRQTITDRPLVGIAWQGGTLKTARGTRTLSLSALSPILSIPGMNFISVQYGNETVDEEAEVNDLWLMPDREFETIHKTIADCDLIISVPQTAVHQAGAMGVPCWVLTPSRPSWPFAGTGSTMPFYKSVELFRQQGDDWSPVIDQIASALRERYALAA